MRKATIEAFLEETTLQHIALFVAMTRAPEAAVESGRKYLFSNGEGQSQGDPLAGVMFTVLIQKDLKLLTNEEENFGGIIQAGADDMMLTGLKNKIMEPAKRFVERLRM